VLAQLQCYANYFWSNLSSAAQSDSTLCLKELRTNWAATQSSEFIEHDGPDRAINQALTEKLTYFSADTATMTQHNDDYPGLQVTSSNGSSWVPCHTVETASITVHHVSDHQLVVKFVSDRQLADGKDVCQAALDPSSSAYSQLQLGTTRMLFQMTR
jgi:hypothetical protein